MNLKEKLIEKISLFSKANILVLGDIMLDQFVWGEVTRISPEAPVPIVEVEKESFLLGGAANVANNLKSLKVNITLSGIIGTDNFGQLLTELCQKNSIDIKGLVLTKDRPTTLKTRIIARGQQVVRVDRENSKPISLNNIKKLEEKLDKVIDSSKAIIVSDYNKGVVTSHLMEFIIKKAKSINIPVLIDPKPSNLKCYSGATVITPNKREAEELSGSKIASEQDIKTCAEKLAKKLDLEAVLITRGPEGMDLWQQKKGLFSIPTMAREVFDVTGAGDTVISIFTLGIVSGLSMCEAAYLANLAAGIVVGKIGTATVTQEELLEAIKQAPEIPIKSK